MTSEKLESNIVRDALIRAKRSMYGVFGFSFVVNLLLLTSPIFMLQVYDRVLLSRSESTLAGLLVVAVFLLVLFLVLEIVRNFLLNRISVRFDRDLSKVTLSELLSRGSVSKPIHDVNAIRSFLNAPFVLALFDAPWIPLYLGLVYLLHPMLGHIGVVGAIILFSLAVLNDRITRESAHKANEAFGGANEFVEHSARNKDAVLGMGMLPSLLNIWGAYQQAGMGYHIQTSDRIAFIAAVAKAVRQIIQVSVLAMGAYLTIQDLSSAGVMIAASIIIGKGLAPIEQSIQGWRGLTRVKESYLDLCEFMEDYEALESSTPLPTPKGKISLQNVISSAETHQPDGTIPKPVIKGMSFEIMPGESVGITGPSGSGKTTLVKLILGIVRPLSGIVRIDGAELTPEVQKQFSSYFGYLPQEVDLFSGSVTENIARFREDDPAKVVAAAQLAGAHDLILSLSDGYDTRVGPAGENLSGGQRQRIGLARAIYDNPSLVILDEPSANLDNDGRLALLETVKQLKQKGITTLLIAHQPSLFAGMDKVAFIADGQVQKFGPALEVIQEMNPNRVAAKETKGSTSLKERLKARPAPTITTRKSNNS